MSNTKTFKGGLEGTIIDITLTNDKGNDIVDKRRVLEDESFSDHKYMYFEIDSKQKKADFRDWRHMDWSRYGERVAALTKTLKLEGETTNMELNHAVDTLNESCLLYTSDAADE